MGLFYVLNCALSAERRITWRGTEVESPVRQGMK